MTISRFSLRDKLTLRLLKLYFNIADVVEWSRALDIRLSDWCCSVSMMWVQIPLREEQNLSAQRSNSNTVWFNFQTYIYIHAPFYMVHFHAFRFSTIRETIIIWKWYQLLFNLFTDFRMSLLQKCCGRHDKFPLTVSA